MNKLDRSSLLTSTVMQKRLKKRYAAERRFKALGQTAIIIALVILCLLLTTIGSQSLSAFSRHYIYFDVTASSDYIDPEDARDPVQISTNIEGIYRLIRDELFSQFTLAGESRHTRRELTSLVTRLAFQPTAKKLAANLELIDKPTTIKVPLSDDLDLYLKGKVLKEQILPINVPLNLEILGDNQVKLTADTPVFADIIENIRAGYRREKSRIQKQLAVKQTALAAINMPVNSDRMKNETNINRITATISDLKSEIAHIDARLEQLDNGSELDSNTFSYLLGFRKGVIRAHLIETNALTGQIIHPIDPSAEINSNLHILKTPENQRNISDRQIAWTHILLAENRIKKEFNMSLFTNADSTYPEIAGIAAAFVGSFWTILATLMLAVPIGIMAAIYLEEFASQNWFNDFIEVNINNLGAVPSVVFGLLGAAVFLNGMGLPRSAPLVGGMVLALMTLPTVIIASRAALKSVPASIRDAALGVGASPVQTTFHHVLPLAAPGMLTGVIIGLARALGETAPLLLIGMVAFIAQIPTNPTEPSTVLPVLIYKWSTGAERAWEPMISAAIIVLLFFMIVMNGLAVYLRWRFERRW